MPPEDVVEGYFYSQNNIHIISKKRGKKMTPEDVLKELRVIVKECKGAPPTATGVLISDMAEKVANAIESLLSVRGAMMVLTKALKEDKTEGSYYHSWQSNIACAIMDTFPHAYRNPNLTIGGEDIHKLANEAATRFLDNLIRD